MNISHVLLQLWPISFQIVKMLLTLTLVSSLFLLDASPF